MQLHLDNFEHEVDGTILARGLEYFEKGCIDDVEVDQNGKVEATVFGSGQYRVSLKLKGNLVEMFNCDCPYDYGPVCKHLVAVLFYLNNEFYQFDISENQKKKPKKRGDSVAGQFKKLLAKLSEEELRQYLIETSKADHAFRNRFVSSFGYLLESSSIKQYRAQIRSILGMARDRNGFIYYDSTFRLRNDLMPLLENAQNCLENGNYGKTFHIAAALMDEMVEALDFADDSNGDIGYFPNAAEELLYALSKTRLSDDLRMDIFNYCLDRFDSTAYMGWDWHLSMLQIAGNLCATKKEADTVTMRSERFESEWSKDRAQLIVLELYQRFKPKDQLTNFIQNNLKNVEIRRYEAHRMFEEGDYEALTELCHQGIAWDREDKPGLVKQWQDWLLTIAIARENQKEIIRLARLRFVDGFSGKYEYYELLKEHVPPENWPSFLENLIDDLKKANRYGATSRIQNIYIKEKDWDKLFQQLRANPYLDHIKHLEPYLKQDYAAELVTLYTTAIESYLKQNVGRKYYKYACSCLRRMKKLGGHEETKRLTTKLRQIYNRRPALMEELDKV